MLPQVVALSPCPIALSHYLVASRYLIASHYLAAITPQLPSNLPHLLLHCLVTLLPC